MAIIWHNIITAEVKVCLKKYDCDYDEVQVAVCAKDTSNKTKYTLTVVGLGP